MKEDSQMIDVLPYDFLQLLALPEGDLQKDDQLMVQSGIYKTNFIVQSIAPKLAVVEIVLNTDKSADLFDAKAKGSSADGSKSIDMDMNTEMDMDMETHFGADMTMQLSPEDQAAMDLSKAMSPDMSAKIQASFNPAFGRFEMVAGTVSTKMNAMGLKMEVNSVLEMRRVQ
jgi:hypothetical protein